MQIEFIEIPNSCDVLVRTVANANQAFETRMHFILAQLLRDYIASNPTLNVDSKVKSGSKKEIIKDDSVATVTPVSPKIL